MARIRTRSRTASCVSSGTYTAVSSLARRRRARDCASRAARQHRATDRLAQAAPASQTLLVRAAERGANLGTIAAALMRLLERYGAIALQVESCLGKLVATAFVELVRHGLPELRRRNDWATLPAGRHHGHPSRNSPAPSVGPAAKPR